MLANASFIDMLVEADPYASKKGLDKDQGGKCQASTTSAGKKD